MRIINPELWLIRPDEMVKPDGSPVLYDPVSAAVSVAGNVIGGLIGGSGAQSAANTQAAAQQAAAAQQEQMYQQNVARLQPFVDAGAGAAGTLQAMNKDPNSYLNTGLTTAQIDQFLNPAFSGALQYGLGAQTNLQNMSGGAFSGNTLAANTQYAGNQFLNNAWTPAVNAAMGNQQNIIGNLQNLATMGSNAAGNNSTGASSFGQQIGQNIAGAGASQAGGTVGVANAIGGAINNAGTMYGLQNYLGNAGGGTSTMASLYSGGYGSNGGQFGTGTLNPGV